MITRGLFKLRVVNGGSVVRMWMIDPRLLCRQHLLGEHGEIHKHRHNFVKRHSMRGRIGQIEPLRMKQRHDELASEMLRRGMDHRSPYDQPFLSYLSDEERLSRVNIKESKRVLRKRCKECERIQNENAKNKTN